MIIGYKYHANMLSTMHIINTSQKEPIITLDLYIYVIIHTPFLSHLKGKFSVVGLKNFAGCLEQHIFI